MLLQEEQHIVHWLTEYGALTKTQVIRMLKDKPPQTAEKNHPGAEAGCIALRYFRWVLSGGRSHVPAGPTHDSCGMGAFAVH